MVLPPSDPPTLATLPNDILHIVFNTLPLSSLAVLPRTSSAVRACTLPFLYKTVTIGSRPPPSTNTEWQKSSESRCALLNLFNRDPHVATYVKELYVLPRALCSHTEPVLPKLPNLRTLVVTPVGAYGCEPITSCITFVNRRLHLSKDQAAGPEWQTDSWVSCCHLLKNHQPPTLVVKVDGLRVDDILNVWSDFFPFSQSEVKRLVVITDTSALSVNPLPNARPPLWSGSMNVVQIYRASCYPLMCPYPFPRRYPYDGTHFASPGPSMIAPFSPIDLTIVDAEAVYRNAKLYPASTRDSVNTQLDAIRKLSSDATCANPASTTRIVGLSEYWKGGGFEAEWDPVLTKRAKMLAQVGQR